MSKIRKFQYILDDNKNIIPIFHDMLSECEKDINENMQNFIENFFHKIK